MGWGLIGFHFVKPWVKLLLVAAALVAFVLAVSALQGCGGSVEPAAAPATCELVSPPTATAKGVWRLAPGATVPATCDELGDGGTVQCSPGVDPCR